MRASDRFHSPTPEDIMEYLDGEGTTAARADIAAHLASCAQCQAVADDQRELSARAHAWRVPGAPASLTAPAADEGRVARFRALSPRARWVVVALPAAAAVLLAVWIDQGPRSVMQDTRRLESAARSAAAMPDLAGAPPAGMAGGVVGGLSAAPAPPAVARQALSQDAAARGPRTPAIIRTAVLRIVVKDFAAVRESVEALVAQANGFVDRLTVTGDASEARTLTGALRVPSDRMADTLTRLRAMGQVTDDTQGSQDVSDQIVDLDARLASARATEQRLIELIRNRTGRLSDVLEVERELTRVRLDIERLDAEKTNLGRRVSYATIDITISEERKARIDGPLSFTTRVRVAAADGLESALESIVALLLLVLRAGPALVLWGIVAGLGWLLLRNRLGLRNPR